LGFEANGEVHILKLKRFQGNFVGFARKSVETSQQRGAFMNVDNGRALLMYIAIYDIEEYRNDN
jgi:hypothetical protein